MVTNFTPLETPAAWHGDELFQRQDWSVLLTESDVDELVQAERRVGSDLGQITTETFSLPTLAPKLKRVQHALEHGSGATLIRGLPLDRFSEEQITRVYWGLVCHIGTPLSQSASGERVFHVRDEGYQLDDPRARGPNTRKRLSFHTDRCDVIAFLCLRPAKSGGDNDLVSSPSLYNEIGRRRPDLLAQLQQPYHYKRHNVDLGNQQAYCRQPVFSFCEGHFAGSFLRVLIDRAYADPTVPAMTDLQREALDYLEEVAEEPLLHARLRQDRGDLLLLNNWVTFHRRTEFQDHEQPEMRRHILRVWLSVPNSRPIDPLFRENYGATAAGAIRGGMRPAS